MFYDVIVIGGGAAGLMCAIEAGRRERHVLVIDHAKKIGGKILISGGGRCNFTNIAATPANYVSDNPHFCKSALSRYTSSDFINLVEKHGVQYYEKKLGQLFCKNSAQDILNLLMAECENTNIKTLLDCKTYNIAKTHEKFEIKTSTGELACSSLVMATGGL